MPIKDQAIAAYEAAHQQRIDEALQHLIDQLLTGPDGKVIVDPKTITTAHTDQQNHLYVFTDGTVSLAVQEVDNGEWDITVVEQQDDTWTRKSDRINSLAELGEYLSTEAQ